MNKKPEEPNQTEAMFDHVIMIKSYKEHIEEQSEKLIQFFEEETKFDDPLKLIGWRYGEKDREFESLRKQNNGLKIHTRKIEEELANLRFSLNNTQNVGDESRLQQVQQVVNLTANKTNITSTYLGTEDILQQMSNIKQLKQEADEDYSQYKQKYDQLLQYLFKSLSQSATAHQLKKEMQPAASVGQRNQQEMVVVPRIRYEKLIQIYSLNMAEISANEIKSKISTADAQSIATHLNYIEQQKKQYREDYSDIVKDTSIELKDLGSFFKALARKVGVEGEWDRYHQKNENEAIALKGKIEAIMKSYEIEPVNKPDDFIASPSLMRSKLTLKISALMNVLSFEQKEKKIWADLSEKIKQDELLDFTNIFTKSQQKIEQQCEELARKIASFSAYSLKNCAEHLETLLAGRINAKVLSLDEIDNLLELTSLQKEIKSELKENKEGDVWLVSRKVVDSKMEGVVKILEKSLVFMSHSEIYRAHRKK